MIYWNVHLHLPRVADSWLAQSKYWAALDGRDIPAEVSMSAEREVHLRCVECVGAAQVVRVCPRSEYTDGVGSYEHSLR